MKNELSWSEKHITTRIPAYKKFIKKFESNTEEYLNKGLSKTQGRFLEIYNRLNYEKAKEGYAFKIAVLYKNRLQCSLYISSLKAFFSQMDLLEFSDKHTYIYQDIPNQFEICIKNELEKEKFLSDLWVKELEKRTDLSSGLTLTQIDERRAYHLLKHMIEAEKLGIEITPFIEEHTEDQIVSVNLTGKKTVPNLMVSFRKKTLAKF
ncbi:hypothetical protein [Chryseobacterium turcicum]|uniref:Uncharacterized protein n=1 Tax=Chryseobacterium turcicum TaxID=2898076 RepID=A0A9Q3V5I6_9FLAO|nr:hypothetical protein [Chryseobacterium turcicum]MCD1117499.1 hypothetical protein [Chryseobacterium turcicum]